MTLTSVTILGVHIDRIDFAGLLDHLDWWVVQHRAHRSDQPEHWKERAEERPGSWWEDWMAWLKPRAGALVAAPPLASEQYPELAPAPGTYVLEH